MTVLPNLAEAAVSSSRATVTQFVRNSDLRACLIGPVVIPRGATRQHDVTVANQSVPVAWACASRKRPGVGRKFESPVGGRSRTPGSLEACRSRGE